MKRRLTTLFLALLLALPLGGLTQAWAEEETLMDYSSMDTAYYTRFKGQGRSLNVYNWGEYISDGSHSTISTLSTFPPHPASASTSASAASRSIKRFFMGVYLLIVYNLPRKVYHIPAPHTT